MLPPPTAPYASTTEQVAALRDQRVLNEMSVHSPFEFLLADAAKLKGWTFIAELSGKSGGAIIRPDGALRDRNSLPRGYWEAKDTQDDLDTEIKKKIARGYPLTNIIFDDTQTGVLFQSKQKINGPFTLGNPKELAGLLNQFFSYTEPDIEGFEEAVGRIQGTRARPRARPGGKDPAGPQGQRPVPDGFPAKIIV